MILDSLMSDKSGIARSLSTRMYPRYLSYALLTWKNLALHIGMVSNLIQTKIRREGI
jgi:hypothetical protein